MKIQNVGLKFKGSLSPIKTVKKIVVHHPAHKTWDIVDIHKAHMAKGWAGIGYNYFVTKDGQVQQGRGMNVGAHAANFNSTTLGVSFQGNFELEHPTEKQLRAGAELIAQLIKDTGINIHDVIGHKDIAATVCPGKNFSLSKLRNYILEDMNPKAKVEQAPVATSSVQIQTGGLSYEMVKEVAAYLAEKKWWAQIQYTSDGKNPTVITGGLDPNMQKDFETFLKERDWWYTFVK